MTLDSTVSSLLALLTKVFAFRVQKYLRAWDRGRCSSVQAVKGREIRLEIVLRPALADTSYEAVVIQGV